MRNAQLSERVAPTSSVPSIRRCSDNAPSTSRSRRYLCNKHTTLHPTSSRPSLRSHRSTTTRATHSTTLGERPMNTLQLQLPLLVPLPRSITVLRVLGLPKVTHVAPCLAFHPCLIQLQASISSQPTTDHLLTPRNTRLLPGTHTALTVAACTVLRDIRPTSWPRALVPRLSLFRTRTLHTCLPAPAVPPRHDPERSLCLCHKPQMTCLRAGITTSKLLYDRFSTLTYCLAFKLISAIYLPKSYTFIPTHRLRSWSLGSHIADRYQSQSPRRPLSITLESSFPPRRLFILFLSLFEPLISAL